MALDRELTIVFDERTNGFVGFQTYAPDSGLSINNRFFTFQGGFIWEHHNEAVPRNEFYDINNPSIIRVVFNDEPSTIKNFKTIGYEGIGRWGVTSTTDQESTVIDSVVIPSTRTVSGRINTDTFDTNGNQVTFDEFVNREGKKFGYIRGEAQTTPELARISVQGLGVGTIIVTTVGETSTGVTTLSAPPGVDLDIGDVIYFFQAGDDGFASVVRLAGAVTAINGNAVTFTYTGSLLPTDGDFYMFAKNNIAETSGVIGFYNIIEFSSHDLTMVELFSINTEVILSST